MGVSFTSKGIKTPINGLIYKVINAIQAGKLKIIKKDKKNNFLTCTDSIIPKKSLVGKWKNKKCLVDSNRNKS